MAIVTPEEALVYFGPTIGAINHDQLALVIDLVQGELEAYLDRPLEPTTFVESVVVNLVEPILYLRNTPVLSVTSVLADGGTVDPNEFTVRKWGLDFAGFNTLALSDPVVWTPSTSHFTWQQTPDVGILATGAYPQSTWTIEYRAGLDGAHINGLRGVLLEAVRRVLAGLAEGLAAFYTRMKVEDYDWQKNERLIIQMIGNFTPGDIRILQKYRRKSIS